MEKNYSIAEQTKHGLALSCFNCYLDYYDFYYFKSGYPKGKYFMICENCSLKTFFDIKGDENA